MPSPKKKWAKPEVRQLSMEEIATLPREVQDRFYGNKKQLGRRVA